MTKKIIIENALDAKTFVQVQKHMLSFQYPWNFVEGVSHTNSRGDFQFVHTIHEGPYVDIPNDYQLVYPLMEVLQPQSIVRIKANLLTQTPEHIVHGMHNDVFMPFALTAIYYINTNNGYTIFEDGDKVESVANRMVIFPANIKHSGATCTDKVRRVVINLNYIPNKEDDKFQALIDDKGKEYWNYWEKDMEEYK